MKDREALMLLIRAAAAARAWLDHPAGLEDARRVLDEVLDAVAPRNTEPEPPAAPVRPVR